MINTFSMIDCGAIGMFFINFLFAQLHELKMILLQHFCDLTIADGQVVSSDSVIYFIWISCFFIKQHIKTLKLYITKLG